MNEVIAAVLAQCQNVIAESYFRKNTSQQITYPYLVFSYDSDNRDKYADGAYLDVTIFDNQGSNDERIEIKTAELKQALRNYSEMLDSCYIRARFEGGNMTDTGSDMLQRRDVRFYLVIDWRN